MHFKLKRDLISNYIKFTRKIISLKEKNSFIKINLAKDVDVIKNFYSSLGFNFTKVVSKFNKIDKIDVHSRKYEFSLKEHERNFLKSFFNILFHDIILFIDTCLLHLNF